MIVIKKRSLIIVSSLLATVIAFLLCFNGIIAKGSVETVADKTIVVLDAGHGGIDGGVCGSTTGIKESELNLSLVMKLKGYLTNAGMHVVLTRSTSAGLYGVANSNLKSKDMKKRKEIINNAKPNLVVSIHMNNYSLTTRRGAQVFYKDNSENGELLAMCVQDSFNKMKEAVRFCEPLVGDYYILNCSDYPSIIAECGFLSNPEDESLLITDEYQDSVAYAIYKGIVAYLTKLN